MRRCVLTIADIANILGKNKKAAAVYAKRMVDKGLAQRVMGGRISLGKNDFAVASQLIQPSYISLYSAVYLKGLMLQVPSRIELATTKNTRTIAHFSYYKISPKFFFGFEKTDIAGCYAMVAFP